MECFKCIEAVFFVRESFCFLLLNDGFKSRQSFLEAKHQIELKWGNTIRNRKGRVRNDIKLIRTIILKNNLQCNGGELLWERVRAIVK